MTEENKLKEAAVEKYHTMASIVTMDKEEFITAMINFSKSQAAREYWQKEQSRVDVEGLRRKIKDELHSIKYQFHADEPFDVIAKNVTESILPYLSSKQEESKWISVTEKVPPENEQIIVAYHNELSGIETICAVYRNGRILNLEEAVEFDEDQPIHVEIPSIEFWMPLPAPPSKG